MPSGSSKDVCHQDKNGENGHCAFEDLDHSVLQQPLNLGVTNIKQILKCIQSGSREVKDIVLNECNIIYECKACVGLFRSLANFIYHKRCYCKKHLCEDMLLFDNFEETETIVVKPEAPEENSAKTSENPKLTECTVNEKKSESIQEMECDPPKSGQASGTSSNSKEKNVASDGDKSKGKPVPTKTESSMISRRTRDKTTQPKMKAIISEEPPIKCAKIISAKLLRKEMTEKLSSKKSSQSDTSNKAVKKAELSKTAGTLEKSVPTFPKIVFKSIDSNPHAVYQGSDKKKLESFGVNSKYENSTVETKVDNDKLIIVLKKDGKSDTSVSSKPSGSGKSDDMEKLSDFHLTRRKRLMSRSDCNVQELRCLTCKTQFMSLKTLYFHMLSLHSKKRLYYPCPFCKTLFVQMYGVTRHLISIHNKSKEQINKLRDVIKKKSVWKRIDDVNPTGDAHVVSPINYQIKAEEPVPEVKVETPPEVKSEYSERERDPDSIRTVIKVGKNVTLHQCSKCNRVFGRKSSQVSHQKFCIMNSSVKSEPSDVSSSLPQPANSPMVSFLTSPSKLLNTSKSSSVLQVKKTENNQGSKSSLERHLSSDIKINIRPKRGAEKRMHKDFVNSQTLKWRSANRIETNANSKPPAPVKKPNGKNLEKKVLSIMDADSLNCLKCDKTFSSYSNLRRHVAIHVGWTRFKCKYCDYQAYNKSQCWAHIQKTHSVDDVDMDKSIVNLVNCNSASGVKKPSLPESPVTSSKRNNETSTKTTNSKSSSSKVKISKKKSVSNSKSTGSEKKQVQIQKKDQPEVKRQIIQIDLEKEPECKKTPSPVIPLAKIIKKEIAEIKKDKPQATITIQKFPKRDLTPDGNKKDKPQHIIPIQKFTIPDYKRDTSYKSVTTSNPTTIILSKKIPSSTVQSIVTLSPESISSPSKISPIRTSPRKNEIKGSEEKLITTLVTRSNTNTKVTPIQIKLTERSNSVEEVSQDSADKNCSKKERLISEWFPKKDLSSTNIRRESAPLIIGLVPAANAGVSARAKNPIPQEKEDS